jgi:Acetyltransferase (isoleucine patch superfamily)
MPICNQKTFFRGRGHISIGKDCVFGYKIGGFHYGGSIELQARTSNSIIILCDKVMTNNNIFICAANRIEIGEGTLIGSNVTIMDFEAHGILPQDRKRMGDVGEVNVGNNVWIGNNVIILKDTKIGDNCIVAAGAVVKGTFLNNVIIGGIPAKIIKSID